METEIYYRITKDKCQEMIDNRVCSSCGEQVEPLETVDNANNPTYWAGCKSCDRFDWGVTTVVFKIAKEMVDNRHHIAYSYLGVKENHLESEWDEWYKSQYSGTCRTVSNILNIYNK